MGSIVYHADLQALLYTHICASHLNNKLFSQGLNRHTLDTHIALLSLRLKKKKLYYFGCWLFSLHS